MTTTFKQSAITDGTGSTQGTGWSVQNTATQQGPGVPETNITSGGSGGIPAAQTFSLANNSYKTIFDYSVTGQTTSNLQPFGWVAGSQTYSNSTETTQGPAFWMGYNPLHLSAEQLTSTHGAIGISSFADAGDTWNPATGGHGLEFSPGCFLSPDGTKATNAIEIVACDDNTDTVTLSLRCGSGSFTTAQSSLYGSIISMSDSANNSYMTAGPFNNLSYNGNTADTIPGIYFGQPTAFGNAPYFYVLAGSGGPATWLWENTQTSTNGAINWTVLSVSNNLTALWEAGAVATFEVLGTTGTTFLVSNATSGALNFKISTALATTGNPVVTINSNSGQSTRGQLAFQTNTSNDWLLQDISGSLFYLMNNSGNAQILCQSGSNASNYNAAITYLLTQTYNYGSFIVNNGGSALATTATDGFLYIPECAGVPTGVPTTKAGSVPLVYDITDDKLYIYHGSWKTTTVFS